MMSNEEIGTYAESFGEKFQQQILAVLVRVPGVAVRYRSALDYQFFTSEIHRVIAKALLAHMDSYRYLPSEATLIEHVREEVPDDLMEQVEKTISKLMDANVSDAQAVTDKLVEFGKTQAMVNAVIACADDLEKGDRRKIIARVQEAQLVGEDILDIGTDYLGTLPERAEWYEHVEQDLDVVPTGLYHLDVAMGGGLGRGELGVVIAPPKRGKCLAPYARVWSPMNGYNKIGELEASENDGMGPDTTVFGIDARTQRPAEARVVKYHTDKAKPIIEVRLRSGRIVTGLAETHPVLTQRGWIPAGRLVPGDYTFGARKLLLNGTCTHEQEVEAWFHGVMAGDGGLTGKRPTLHLHQVDDLCIVERIEQFFPGMVGARFDDSDNGCRWSISTEYWRMLHDFGEDANKAPAKEFPDRVWWLGVRGVAAFLAGLFDTDGSAYLERGRPVVEFGSASRHMADGVLTALNVLGVYATLREKTVRLGEKTFNAYVVAIRDGEGVLAFYEACAHHGAHTRKWSIISQAKVGRGQYYTRLPHTVWEEVLRQRGGKSRWDSDTMSDLFQEVGLSNPRKASEYVRRAVQRQSRVSVDVARKIGEALGCTWITQAACGDYVFDEVVSVHVVDRCETLDIEVEDSAHTFMVDGVFTHNTTLLVNMGFGALMSTLNLNVVHYSMEIVESVGGRTPHKVSKRYDDRLAGPYIRVKKTDPAKYAELIQARAKKFLSGRLYVKSYPTRTAAVSTLRNHLSLLASRNFKPDLCIVDYGDIMKAERRLGEMRHEQAGIYEDLRALGGEFDMAVWTASQTSRGALEKEVVTMADFAECFEKAAIIDAGIAFCQTEAERIDRKCRLFLAGLRNEEDGRTIECAIKRDRALIETIGLLDVGGYSRVGDDDEEDPLVTSVETRAAAEKLKDDAGIKKPHKRPEKSATQTGKQPTKKKPTKHKRPSKKLDL